MRSNEQVRDTRMADMASTPLQQKVLGSLLENAGRALHEIETEDPLLAMESSLVALHAVCTWLEPSTVHAAMQEVNRAHLEDWEAELRAGVACVQLLQRLVQEELHLSLQERNRRRSDLVPGTN